MMNRPAQKESNQKRSLKQNAIDESNWQKIINGIVRPPRSHYRQSSLGSRAFILNETRYTRNEVMINHKGKNLILTTFQPQSKNEWIILYLHGNSSSRLQATSILRYLPFRFSLASFDFIGCGHNVEGDTISLGVKQAQQVETVCNYLTLEKYRIVLWGRSMGAATALKYGKAPIIVSDSCFYSFRGLCISKAKQKSPKCIPNCLIGCLFPCVYAKLRSDIKKRADYDIAQLEIMDDVNKISQQTLVVFMSGNDDKLIDKVNSQKLYNSFKGSKKFLEIFQGTHNTKRPHQTIKQVMRYIIQQIDDEESTNKADLIDDHQIIVK